jgi:uncharacterized membrane protein
VPVAGGQTPTALPRAEASPHVTTHQTSGTELTLPAKRPRTAVAGPYGHPFHPILVTVPIGAWVASLVFDLVAVLGDADRQATFAEGAFWLIVIGIAGAALAALFGIMDLLTIPSGTRAATTALTHMALNTGVLVLFAVNALLRWSDGRDDVTGVHLALTVIALLALGVSGWLGGKLSYRYGVRVADERTQTEGFRRQA